MGRRSSGLSRHPERGTRARSGLQPDSSCIDRAGSPESVAAGWKRTVRCKRRVQVHVAGVKDSEAIMADAKVPAGMPGWIQNHVRQYLESGGVEGHMWDSSVVGGPGPLPTLLLTTTGRKSGAKQLVPLIYGRTDGGVVVIASKGGAPEDPGWYRNLTANSEVEVQVGTERSRAKASTVEGTERSKLWEQMVGIYPPYAEYQKKTERRIPVVVLKRVG